MSTKNNSMETASNIASHISINAQKYPYSKAVIFAHGRDHQGRISYTHYTFSQLDKKINCLAHGIISTGLKAQDRAVVLIPPSLDMVVLVFALIKAGLVPVIFDPSMGVKQIVSHMDQVKPAGFFGTPKSLMTRVLFPTSFRTVRVSVTVGKRYGWGGDTLDRIGKTEDCSFEMATVQPESPALTIFSPVVSGMPKEVNLSHEMIHSQIDVFHSFLSTPQEETLVSTVPVFMLLSILSGISTVIPDVPFDKPQNMNPIYVVENIENQGSTTTVVMADIWKKLEEHCISNKIQLLSLRKVLLVGESASLNQKSSDLSKISPDGKIFMSCEYPEKWPISFSDRL